MQTLKREALYAFTPRAERIYRDMKARLLPNRYRERTLTNPRCDGKTPFIDAFERYADEPYEVCLAHAIVDSWKATETLIHEDELIVGIARPRRPACEHFSYGIQRHDDDELMDSPAYAPNKLAIRRRLDAVWPRMEPLSYDSHVGGYGAELYPDGLFEQMNDGLWWVGGYQGHTIPSYPKLLALGVDATMEQIRHYQKINEADPQKQIFYRAITIVLSGFSEYIEGYASAADAAAERAESGAIELREIARTCRHVAHSAPNTLIEAAQLMWFYCLWDWADCVGRIDQYLYPFFKACKCAEGGEAAESVIAAIWFKLLENGVHNLTLSGVNPDDGRDATNELTELLLNICRRCHETHPRVSVRFHANSPRWLMDAVVRMWADGMSDPSIVSDKSVLKGLTAYGVPLNDARDYSVLGCQEIEIPGKSNFGCEDGSFNLAKVLEYTMHDGRDALTGRQVGPRTGELADFSSIKALWDAYDRQFKNLIPNYIDLCNRGVHVRSANCAKLVKSIYTEACVERGLNLDDGGSVYNYGVIETAGSSVVADSFAAIETIVFKQKFMTMQTLQAAIDADFVGYERERQLLSARASKFGNDDPVADKWCKRVLSHFWNEIGRYRSARGGAFMGACALLQGGIKYGKFTGSTPDGRRRGEPLGNTIGPREGNDVHGPTAMLKSVAKLPLHLGAGGSTLNVLLPKSLMQSYDARGDIADMMLVFMASGGQMAQITTADLEALKDAKLHPEKHGNLIVRVGGFSIAFVELCDETQNEIISRYGAQHA